MTHCTTSSSSAGGAAGLELATGLGDKLGKRKQGQHHADRAFAHPSLEAAAARGGGRQHERRQPRARLSGPGPLASFPLPLRRDDRARPEPSARSAWPPPTTTRATRSRPARIVPLRHAGDGGGQHQQRFRNAGRQGVRDPAGYTRTRRNASTSVWSTPASAPMPSRAGAAGAASCRDHRSRRHRHRTGGAAASHHPPDRRLLASTGSTPRRTSASP